MQAGICDQSCDSLQESSNSATPSAIGHQAPLSMGYSRQEYWNGLLFPPPGIFPTHRLNPCFLHLLHWQADSLLLHHLGNPVERLPEVIHLTDGPILSFQYSFTHKSGAFCSNNGDVEFSQDFPQKHLHMSSPAHSQSTHMSQMVFGPKETAL